MNKLLAHPHLLTTFVPVEELRFIDQHFLHTLVSQVGQNERYSSGKTSHTIHVWWARRPHLAMRLLVFASLCKYAGLKARNLLSQLSAQYRIPESLQNEVHEFFKQQYTNPPKVLDIFGGGGTIAFEAASLGFEASSVDINPLSTFIQKSYLELFQQGDKNLNIAQIKQSGLRILSALKEKSAEIYPLRTENGPIVYLWTYRRICSCGYECFLTKRPWIDKKNKNEVLAFNLFSGPDKQELRVVKLPRDKIKSYGKQFLRTSIHKNACPQCGRSIDLSIKDTRDEMIGVFYQNNPGKVFVQTKEPSLDLESTENQLLGDLGISYDTFGKITSWSGITNPTLYGIETYADFLNQRQRIVLLMLLQCLRDEYTVLNQTKPLMTKLVIAILSSLIDQLVDWNSRLSIWIAENMQIGRSFSGPGVAMYWDYAEIDPCMDGPANLYKKLDRIISGLKFIPKFLLEPKVFLDSAQNISFDDETFDAVITDPPYYDNLYYNILADFIYSWKRQILRPYFPNLFANTTTYDPNELVASKQLWGENSHSKYIEGMINVFDEVFRVLKSDGVFTFVYSHGSYLGWDAILYPFQCSGFVISSVQPLLIERKARPRGMNSQSVNICLSITAHKVNQPKPKFKPDVFTEQLQELVPSLFKEYNSLSWDTADIGLTLFANSMGLLMNYSRVEQLSIRLSILDEIVSTIQLCIPEFRLAKRTSL